MRRNPPKRSLSAPPGAMLCEHAVVVINEEVSKEVVEHKRELHVTSGSSGSVNNKCPKSAGKKVDPQLQREYEVLANVVKTAIKSFDKAKEEANRNGIRSREYFEIRDSVGRITFMFIRYCKARSIIPGKGLSSPRIGSASIQPGKFAATIVGFGVCAARTKSCSDLTELVDVRKAKGMDQKADSLMM